MAGQANVVQYAMYTACQMLCFPERIFAATGALCELCRWKIRLADHSGFQVNRCPAGPGAADLWLCVARPGSEDEGHLGDARRRPVA